MRPGTALVIVILIAAILAASTIQLVFLGT